MAAEQTHASKRVKGSMREKGRRAGEERGRIGSDRMVGAECDAFIRTLEYLSLM